MRSLTVLGLVVVLSGTGLHAQSLQDPRGADRSPLGRLQSYRQCDLRKLERPLLNSLGHDVEGVVVSALREAAKLALAQPGSMSDRIVSQVEVLLREGATAAIRYRAFLTTNALSAPYLFAAEGMTEFQTDEEFFIAVARKLEMLALGQNR